MERLAECSDILLETVEAIAMGDCQNKESDVARDCIERLDERDLLKVMGRKVIKHEIHPRRKKRT